MVVFTGFTSICHPETSFGVRGPWWLELGSTSVSVINYDKSARML
jgi:hypothetical protein